MIHHYLLADHEKKCRKKTCEEKKEMTSAKKKIIRMEKIKRTRTKGQEGC